MGIMSEPLVILILRLIWIELYIVNCVMEITLEMQPLKNADLSVKIMILNIDNAIIFTISNRFC